MQWLQQAGKRYGLAILRYIITSNHVHLLVREQVLIESVKTRLGFRATGRKILESSEWYQLREIPTTPHMALFEAEKEDIDLENARFWNIKSADIY